MPTQTRRTLLATGGLALAAGGVPLRIERFEAAAEGDEDGGENASEDGDDSLEVTALDPAGGEPVAAHVQVWTDGGSRHAESAPDAPATFDLPDGEYAVSVYPVGGVAGPVNVDPEPVTVDGPTAVELEAAAPFDDAEAVETEPC